MIYDLCAFILSNSSMHIGQCLEVPVKYCRPKRHDPCFRSCRPGMEIKPAALPSEAAVQGPGHRHLPGGGGGAGVLPGSSPGTQPGLGSSQPVLASILATSRDSEITLILAGVEREEMEDVLEDIYLGRDRARVFLQQWGLWEEDVESESISGDCKYIGESKFKVDDDIRQQQMPEANSSHTQELTSS